MPALPIGVYPFSHAGAYTGDQFNAWLGVPVARRKAYLPYDQGWSAVVSSIAVLKQWLTRSGGSAVSINIGMGGSLAELAANKIDPATGKKPTDRLTDLAKAISAAVPAAWSKIDVIYPWEFNGFWYSWNSLGREDDFKTCLKRIHDAFKAVDPRFFFWFCMATTQYVRDGGGVVHPVNPLNSSPGPDYIDGFAFDVYRYPSVRPAGTSGPIDSADDATVWNHRLNDAYGLAWAVAKADSYGKAKRITELGVATDAPVFLDLALTWAAVHNVEVDYFNTSDGRDDFTISTGLYPKSAAVLKQHCGPQAA